MNVVLWIVQSLLAAAFLASGAMKVSQPKQKLVDMMGWSERRRPTTAARNPR